MINGHPRVILTNDLATVSFYVSTCPLACETCTVFVRVNKLEV